jgi:hypothetical protein
MYAGCARKRANVIPPSNWTQFVIRLAVELLINFIACLSALSVRRMDGILLFQVSDTMCGYPAGNRVLSGLAVTRPPFNKLCANADAFAFDLASELAIGPAGSLLTHFQDLLFV